MRNAGGETSKPLARIYPALTMQADHHVMPNRDDMNAVIEGVRGEHGLLAAFLEATDKIDGRTLQRRAAIGEMPNAVNVEAHQQTSTTPNAAAVPFAFRRANLVRASE
jgi:hypothetical protein